MRKLRVEDEGRTFQQKWEEECSCSQTEQYSLSNLSCNVYNVERHYETHHKEKYVYRKHNWTIVRINMI